MSDDFVSVNHIIKAAIPGKGFMPGPTQNGGFVKYPFKSERWFKTEEPSFPPGPQERPYKMLEAPGINNKTLWAQNVPLGYPFPKIEYDEGITFIRRDRSRNMSKTSEPVDMTFLSALVGLGIIAFITLKS